MFANNFNFFYTFFILLVIFWSVTRVARLIDRVLSWEEKPLQRFVVQAVTNISLSIVIYLLFKLLGIFLINISFLSENYGYTSFTDIKTTLSIVSVYMLLFVFIDLSIFLLNRWRLSLADIEAFKKENVEFRFNMLRTQINPHFLFNSLNTLSSLIYEDQDQASRYTKKLSTVYRTILEHREAEAITLKEEINSLSHYLELLQTRFGKGFEARVQVSGKAQTALLPPLTLQLLVENAIKHNVVSEKKPLRITLFDENDYLFVQNSLQPKQALEDSTEIGLKNIKSRFTYLTDKNIVVENENNHFTVKIPLVYEA